MVEAHLTGAFPRSERLIEATRASERGKISNTELEAIRENDAQAFVGLQRDGSLDAIVDGQLNWQDLFRPFSELFTGIELGSLTRWFDNNTFYRKPVITGKVTRDTGSFDRYFQHKMLPHQARKKAILPGPFSFGVLAENHAYANFADVVDSLAHALKRTVAELQKAGYSIFQFNEPALAGAKAGDLEVARSAFEVCARGVADKTILQTYFGDASPVINRLLDFPVNCVGVDFYSTSVESLKEQDFNKELGCGFIDGRNSLLEDERNLFEFAEKTQQKLEPKGMVLCPNCDLDFLPQTVAEKKVRLLAETKARLAK